jgi:hypothetical protein
VDLEDGGEKITRKRLFFIVASVVLISLLAALLWVDIDNEQRISKLETTVNDLGKRVEALENITWHPDGNFTLAPSNTTVTFNTQGEAWRMIYTFNGANLNEMIIEYNLRVYDANGNIVGGLNGIELSDIRDSGRGILYIPEGQGTYSVEIRGITGSYTFTFEVESYY